MTDAYLNPGPDREEIDRSAGPLVLEFGTSWCGHCKAGQPLINEAMAGSPGTPCIKVEDGKGRRLGRSFMVKLWPTFIFLKDGIEQARVVRPLTTAELKAGLEKIS